MLLRREVFRLSIFQERRYRAIFGGNDDVRFIDQGKFILNSFQCKKNYKKTRSYNLNSKKEGFPINKQKNIIMKNY